VTDQPSATESARAAGRWSRTLDLLEELEPHWTELYVRMATNPWTSGVLPAKEVQLIAAGLSASITNMDESALRRHIRAALHAGATKAEILEVLKMSAILSLHSMSLGAPILIEEAAAAGKTVGVKAESAPPTPFCDRMKALGQWNQAWDPFMKLDPLWTEQFISAGAGFYTNGVLTPKFVELISIAFDASITHMYAPGTRRHIKAALSLGATLAEITDVLKLCVSQGANALDLGVPILAEEAASFETTGGASDFVEAIDLADLPAGKSTTTTVHGKQVALFNVDGEVFATDDSCPHAGSSLGWGLLEGKVVKCRSHGLRFDVTTGSIVGGTGLAIQTYRTRIEGSKVLVSLR
jgi:nitrite reductase/ring-hydroxylating ferredoxin subunit/alkylhydroperoxidase/carboxymuconolactone decarboxylase family protein YurZ